MPLNKQWFINNIGEENLKIIADNETQNIQKTFEQWCKDEQRSDLTIGQWLETEVALDMSFEPLEHANMNYDDFLYRRLGVNYEYYKNTYEQYISRIEEKFKKYHLPQTLAHMLMWEVWKRLAKTLDFNLYNVL